MSVVIWQWCLKLLAKIILQFHVDAAHLCVWLNLHIVCKYSRAVGGELYLVTDFIQ